MRALAQVLEQPLPIRSAARMPRPSRHHILPKLQQLAGADMCAQELGRGLGQPVGFIEHHDPGVR